jgi:ribonucleoside-diphosphate reductase alpha subunit
MNSEEYVLKRNGELEKVSFDKILNRVKNLGSNKSNNNELNINYTSLCKKIIDRLYNEIPTHKIDELTAQQCASLATTHPDYGTLASRILISNHQKNTEFTFYEVTKKLWENKDIHDNHSPIVNETYYNNVSAQKDELEKIINYERDYFIDYFGFKTLERAYLIKINNKIIERPQHMWLRVAVAIHGTDFEKIKETYHYMSNKYFTHATPTLFNAGTKRQQMSSCYLLAMESDSVHGIYNTLSDCAAISKWAGGIGLHIHNIRGSGSHIRGTNGTSNGLVPMLRVFNETARYIDQGGGRRNGSFAVYLEPWHSDIESFLDMKKNHGDENARARDLFYALWIPDLFMKRVRANKNWTLMCPDVCLGLSEVYGSDFEKLYEQYESEGKGYKTMKARDLWYKVLDSQIETGTPYMLYKNAANKKSNQQNLGTIKSSNLCCEIIEYSNKNESAVCNLASIALNKFILPNKKLSHHFKIYTKDYCKWCKQLKYFLKLNNVSYEEIIVTDENMEEFNNVSETNKKVPLVLDMTDDGAVLGNYTDTVSYLRPIYDFNKLHQITKIVTHNLNNIIDLNFYPTVKTKVSNFKNRPIGIGVQGLADTFINMNIPFHSNDAKKLNAKIFETMYHAALEKSMELAKESEPYSTFEGSPASKGVLQFDMWDVKPSDRYDWNELKEEIKTHGLKNSLLLAPMPTASTSQILGNNECFEPLTSNIYVRRTIAGEFIMINKYLLKDLIKLNLWDENLKNEIIKNNGSIQNCDTVPFTIKEKYKIVWEIPMKHLIEMSADRGAYICQSQSLNLWMKEPTYNKLTSMHFFSWSKGLKTGLYYLRTKAKAAPQQFTIEPEKNNKVETIELEDEEDCLMCGS